MRVLVVGGAGYVGGAVTELLSSAAIPFAVYDSLIYEPHYLKDVEFIRGDIRDVQRLSQALRSVTHVVWLAALVGDGACEVNPALTTAINDESVLWLSENFDGRIILTSTCSVYGQHDAEVTEDSAVNPLSRYAQTKLKAESYLRNKNSLIFRLGTAFGVSDTHCRPRMDLAVNYMTANAIVKGELSVFGGAQWRPLVHVKDIAHAIVDNLQQAAQGVYNIAAINMQIKQLAQIISNMTACRIIYTEQKFQDERNYHVSVGKAVRDGVIGLRPFRTVEEGVREISSLVENGRITQTENDIYFNARYVEKLTAHGQLA